MRGISLVPVLQPRLKMPSVQRPVEIGLKTCKADSVRFSSSSQPSLSLQERFYGAFLALAAGDALGCNLETLTPDEIKQRHGVHREITGGQPTPNFHTWAKGATTDDTDMTLMLSDSLTDHPQWNPWDLLGRFIAWNKTNPPGRGKLTIRVLELADQLDPAKDDVFSAAKQAWQEMGRATNGSLMRCAPIALLFHQQPDKLREVSLESCKLTHYDPACQASTLAYNRVLADVLNNRITDQASIRQSFEAAAKEVGPINPETADLLRKIPTMRSEDVQSKFHTLHTMQTALWAFYHHTNVEDALVDAVNRGGDTDTNAAVTGALMGARYGVNAVPARWRAALLDWPRIEKSAQRLYDTHMALPSSGTP